MLVARTQRFAQSTHQLESSAGRPRWKSEPGEIALADGVLYVGGGHTLWALEARTGEERWHFDNEGPFKAVLHAVCRGGEGRRAGGEHAR